MPSRSSLLRPLSFLFGTLLLLFTACPAFASATFELVYAFPPPTADKPTAEGTIGLIRGIDGSLYGGGFQNGPVIYKLVAAGQSAVVHRLPYDPGARRDVVALVQGADGAFYGAL